MLNAAAATTARGAKGGRGRKGMASAAAKAADAKIDIGGERELQVNLDESEGEMLPQLDPEALAKVKAIRAKLDNLLRHQHE